MKIKKLFSILLLFSFSFTILHGFVMAEHESSHGHCDVEHFVKEFSQADDDHESDDLCSVHHLFHLVYIIPTQVDVAQTSYMSNAPKSVPSFYPIQVPQSFLKPPIA